MRNKPETCVNGHLMICLPVDELQFYYQLLTRLKADDLIDEDLRRRALEWLLDQWVLARSAQRGAWVSQGEMTNQ